MAGNAIDAVNEPKADNGSEDFSLNQAVFNQRVGETPSDSIRTGELNLDSDLSFDNPYRSSDIIETAANQPRSERNLDLAQAGDDVAAKSSDGPLGWMNNNPDSPAQHLPKLKELDQAWQRPYNELTRIGGHDLLERFDAAKSGIPQEMRQIPEAEQQEVIFLATNNLDPDVEISPADKAKLAKYPGVEALVNQFREISGHPNFRKSYSLRESVKNKLEPAIKEREKVAENLTGYLDQNKVFIDGRSLTGASVALITEAKSMTRYKNAR